MTAHARRIAKTIAAGVFVLLLAGFTYQGVATALERRAFRYPGRLVPVGDHQLHVHCTGAGAPTVVLEAPALGFSASWGLVQPPVSRVTRVCAYDRTGLGWSEARDGSFRTSDVPAELRRLLDGAGETGPFIVVGSGLGVAYVSEFAAQFPADTAALVLVDAPPADASGSAPRRPPSPWLARTGILRLSQRLSGTSGRVPGPHGGAVDAFSTRPDHLSRAGQELRQSADVFTRARAVALPPVPVRRIEPPARGSSLATADDAQPVIQAIIHVVEELRGQDN